MVSASGIQSARGLNGLNKKGLGETEKPLFIAFESRVYVGNIPRHPTSTELERWKYELIAFVNARISANNIWTDVKHITAAFNKNDNGDDLPLRVVPFFAPKSQRVVLESTLKKIAGKHFILQKSPRLLGFSPVGVANQPEVRSGERLSLRTFKQS